MCHRAVQGRHEAKPALLHGICLAPVVMKETTCPGVVAKPILGVPHLSSAMAGRLLCVQLSSQKRTIWGGCCILWVLGRHSTGVGTPSCFAPHPLLHRGQVRPGSRSHTSCGCLAAVLSSAQAAELFRELFGFALGLPSPSLGKVKLASLV